MIKAKFIEYPGQQRFQSAHDAANRAMLALKITRALLIAAVVYEVLSIIFDIPPIFRDMPEGKLAYTGLGGITVLICDLGILFGGIFFIYWLYKAYQNLPALGATGLYYTPIWAILGFIIPIANLFIPFYVAADTWRGSYPEQKPGSLELSWEHRPIPNAVKAWWWLYILMVVGIPIIVNFMLKFGYVPSLNFINAIYLIVLIMLAVSTHLVITIVNQSDKRQADRYDEIEIKDVYTRKAVCPACNGELRSKQAKQCPSCFLLFQQGNPE